MQEYLPYVVPLAAVCASALLLVLTIERIIGLLGKIPVSGWFVRHRRQWRLRETKRIENVTAGIILRIFQSHGGVLEDVDAVVSYNLTVDKVVKKYPGVMP